MHGLDTAKISEKLRFKKHLLLQHIRNQGKISRLALARELRLSNSRVCELVRQMSTEGLLLNNGGKKQFGRGAEPIRLNPEYGYIVGFDLEAHWLRLIAVDFSGNIVFKRQDSFSHPPENRNEMRDHLISYISEGLNEIREKYTNLLGIGLACPGLLDIRRGTILEYNLLNALSNLPLRDLIASHSSLPVIMEHNMRAFTLAEWTGGAGHGMQNFLCIIHRSGLGSGLVLNNKLYVGHSGRAGEMAWMRLPVSRSGKSWHPLGKAISRAADISTKEQIPAELPDSQANVIGKLLGSQAGSLATVLDLEGVVLAGKLFDDSGKTYKSFKRSFYQSLPPNWTQDNPVAIRKALMGPYAAALGATHRCFEMLFPSKTLRETTIYNIG